MKNDENFGGLQEDKNMNTSDSKKGLLRQRALERYANLEISAAEAMNVLGLGCYEDLEAETVNAGLNLPRIDRHSALALARQFLERNR